MAIRSAGVVTVVMSSAGSSPRAKQAMGHVALAARRCAAASDGSIAINRIVAPGPTEPRYLKTMLEGLPVWITWPVGVSRPVAGSTRKATMVSLFWLAT